MVVILCSAALIQGNLKVNIAKGKPAYQSATKFGGVASRATDGNKNSSFSLGKTCTHTANVTRSWLAVDLESNYDVYAVKITNRDKKWILRNFYVAVSDFIMPKFNGTTSIKPMNAKKCAYQAKPFGKSIVIKCAKKNGRYVFITKAGVLSVCEVEVFGIDKLTRGRPAVQSSTKWGGVASRATDGNRNPRFENNSCTLTQFQDQSWLSVDLGSKFHVKTVTLYNRLTSKENLSKFYVSISDSKKPQFLKKGIEPVNAHTCEFQKYPFGASITIDCKKKKGRYIFVTKKGYLSICELEAKSGK